MIGYWAEVVKVIKEYYNMQVLEVKRIVDQKVITAIHYIYDHNQCRVGDQIQINTSALDLDLGTGGFGFVMAKYLENNGQEHPSPTYPGHIIKWRYTPQQTPVHSIESPESVHHSLFQTDFSLQGQYILMGELHSMLPVMVSLLHLANEQRKIVYIMDDQASMHMAFSDHVRYLQNKINLITITYGQALGGDIETVNLFTALEAAVKIIGADDIILTQGPGVVGTGTPRGFSGMQLVHWLHTIRTCGGLPITIPRIHFSDSRPAHTGLSHHLLQPLRNHALVSTFLPYPFFDQKNNSEEKWIERQIKSLAGKHQTIPIHVETYREELETALDWYGKPILTMNRGYEKDPYFFYGIGAAYTFYKEMLKSGASGAK